MFIKGMHSVQAEGKAFGTPEELLQAVDLYNLTQRSFRNELQVHNALVGSTPALES